MKIFNRDLDEYSKLPEVKDIPMDYDISNVWGIDMNDSRYLQLEGTERELEDFELENIIDVWCDILDSGDMTSPEDTFTFFGIRPENYNMLEKNVIKILEDPESEPIKKHLINGLCNIIEHHLYGCAYWKDEEGYRTREGVDKRIVKLKRKLGTGFTYERLTNYRVRIHW